MIVNIHYSTNEEPEEVNLNSDELAAFLQCTGIGYDGHYYRITNKVYEFSKDSEESLTVIAEEDSRVTV